MHRPINTVTHREHRCAAPARRATEAYSPSTSQGSGTQREGMRRRSNAGIFMGRCAGMKDKERVLHLSMAGAVLRQGRLCVVRREKNTWCLRAGNSVGEGDNRGIGKRDMLGNGSRGADRKAFLYRENRFPRPLKAFRKYVLSGHGGRRRNQEIQGYRNGNDRIRELDDLEAGNLAPPVADFLHHINEGGYGTGTVCRNSTWKDIK